MKKLLLVGLLFSCLQAMDVPLSLSGSKRTVQDAELADVQTPEKQLEKTQKVLDFSATERSAAQLTKEEKEILIAGLQKATNQEDAQVLQKIIQQAGQRAYTQGATNRAKLFSSAGKIKEVFLSNAQWVPFLTEQNIAAEIIGHLAQKYQVSLPTAALVLGTDAASAWVGQQLPNEQITNEIFLELFQAAHQGNMDVFDFFFKHVGANATASINVAFYDVGLLCVAVEKNNSELVQRLLAVPNIALNAQNPIDGTNSLMYAAAHGRLQILRQLIQAGADLNFTSNQGDTALLKAVKNNQAESVQILVDAGADLNRLDLDENTALIIASKNNDKKALEILIPVAQTNIKNIKDFSALHYLVANGNIQAVRALLNRGAEVVQSINEYDGDHNNPLITAVFKNDMPMVAELIASQARFDVTDKEGNTPLMIAIQKNYPEMIQRLIQRGALTNNKQDASMVSAARQNNLALVPKLIQSGANKNATDKQGNTALMVAAQLGFASMVDALLQMQVDQNIRNREGKTALMIAVQKNNPEVIQKLSQRGALHNNLTNAASKNDLQSVQTLIQSGADLNVTNMFGSTALIIAIQRGFIPIVDALLAAQADPNIQNDDGKTALMIAAEKADVSLIDKLIAGGARSDLKDKNGDTAYAMAVKKGHAHVLPKLIVYGRSQ
jgi:ankyrin repeat protein